MNKVQKECRCKSCGKRLVDEKTFCRRCKLNMRNTGGKLGGLISLIGVSLFANSLADNGKEKNGTSSSD